MIKAFLNNDIHKSTASKVFDVSLKKSHANKEVTQNSKLGIIYGFLLSTEQSNHCQEAESAALIEAYYKT
jgi:DNA polymerase I-like protein with 3'-5' exonuclease and polymerase domains